MANSDKFCKDCKMHTNNPSYCRHKKAYCGRKQICENWKGKKD